MTAPKTPSETTARKLDFVRARIEQDLQQGRYTGVVTRFPPEPNGFPHIGHAKAICIDFDIAAQYGGRCNLRFDDTNPETENPEYVRAIQEDIRWLGYDWGEHLYFASDYYEELYGYAVQLVKKGLAYVDHQDLDTMRRNRGTVTEPGVNSPYRDRSVAENLDLLARMKAGEYPDGTCVLRAKIDMAHANMQLRDPLLYRIRHAHHYRRGDDWCIYPMYDFAHCLGDYIEGVTHSLCTLEFENNRDIYDWVLDSLFEPPRPYQFEFSRLNVSYTITAKRKLRKLVEEGHVTGWDDPRMPTLRGMRRRGYPPEAVRAFAADLGITKTNSVVDMTILENAVRHELNATAPRVMAVLDPLELVLQNVPEDWQHTVEAPFFPDREDSPTRTLTLTRRLLIERGDFAEEPPPKWRRLRPGGEVRLRHGLIVRCDEVEHDAHGGIVRLLGTADLDSFSGSPGARRKVKGTLHWLSADHGLPAEVRVYDRLFTEPAPGTGGRDFLEALNPSSLTVHQAVVEPSIADDAPESRYQFERHGYYVRDSVDGVDALVFNCAVPLRDSWSKRAAPTVQPAEAEPSAPDSRRRRVKRSGSEVRAEARALTPELTARYERYTGTHTLPSDLADKLSGRREVSDFFEAAIAAYASPGVVAKWMVNGLLGQVSPEDVSALPFTGAAFGRLVALVDSGETTGSIAKQVLGVLIEEGGDPAEIIATRGLTAVDDRAALAAMLDEIIAASPAQTERFRDGNKRMQGYFVGQVMRRTQGKADARLVAALLAEKIS